MVAKFSRRLYNFVSKSKTRTGFYVNIWANAILIFKKDDCVWVEMNLQRVVSNRISIMGRSCPRLHGSNLLR